ncbi:glycerate kinase [Metabacillus halosaccharovorans]|uniref:glycerate kinase n=1 Tax=Metabacillus halosaccharovorans TaxID=930124 RepID=UPI001C201238|nr:glycerate kinase [Metabacillus halosaccharovorans]MBU7591096.1 hypothetical protein [Metabacillus halosaccharovorans]
MYYRIFRTRGDVIVVTPDSFKESLNALQGWEIIQEALENEIPDVQVEMTPMADGDEGQSDYQTLFGTTS